MAQLSFNSQIKKKNALGFSGFISPKKNKVKKGIAIAQLGSKTYSLNGGSVSNILSLPSYITAALPTNSQFYFKYKLKTKNGDVSILSSCIKDSSNKIAQSAFTMLNQSFVFSGSVNKPVLRTNDDHDSLFMMPDGTGIISAGQVYQFSGDWDRYKGSSNIDYTTGTDAVFQGYIPNITSKLGGSNISTAISFPLINTIVGLNGSTSYLYINNSIGLPFDSNLIAMFSGLTGINNSIITLSDGVNNFLIYRVGTYSGVLVSIDLEKEQYSTGPIITFDAGIPNTINSTEEDCFGDTLYAIDGSLNYYQYGSLYQDNAAWTSKTNFSTSTNTYIGAVNNTQTGMDLFGSYDSDGYVWFSDWGHDDGGFFGVATDTELGTRKTNILCLKNFDFII